jgi:beta-glucanase (GH16 family)
MIRNNTLINVNLLKWHKAVRFNKTLFTVILVKRIVLLIGLTISSNFIRGQSFINDSNWDKTPVPSKSDNFNSAPLNLSKWEALDVTVNPPVGCWWGGGSRFVPANVSIDAVNGWLKLKITDAFNYNNKYYYNTGGIESVNFDYGYGYYEMSAKFPGFDYNGNPSGAGFWPAFWLWFSNWDDIQNEIDIVDPGCAYSDGSTIGPNWHNNGGASCPFCTYNTGKILFNDFHKYGLEWLPERVVFYFDDQPYLMSFKDATVADHFMRLVIDAQMLTNPPNDDCGVKDHSMLPQYMIIDYFNYYKLKTDCNTDVSILNNNALNSFDFKVKRNISIGNVFTPISLNSSDRITFRATTSITITGDFTAPVGCELFLIPTSCDENTSNGGYVPADC